MKEKARKIEYAKEPSYFLHLADGWNVEEFPFLWTIGDPALIRADLTAIFCSRKCPGKIVRMSHDFADDLRVDGAPVIGGFQTPVEKMCLEVLLKGPQPVVLCPARGIENMRLPPEWSAPVEEGRLLLASPFGPRRRRATKENAGIRNKLVAAAADRLFFLHAAANSSTLAFATELLQEGREIGTFDVEENEELIEAGATRWEGWKRERRQVVWSKQ